MSFNMSTEGNGTERPLVPKGLQQAILVHIIDYGTHKKVFEGIESEKREVRLGFLFPRHTMEIEGEQKPLMLSKWCTLSLHPKSALHEVASSMLGEQLPPTFDITSLVGRNCMINVVHDTSKKTGKPVDRIGSLAPLMDGINEMTAPDGSIKVYSIDSHDADVFALLGEKEKAIIGESPEFKLLDIPF